MLHLDDVEAVLARGRTAEALLAHADFVAVVNDLSTFHMAAIAASPPGPGGREAIEYHHACHFALTEIVSELQGRHDAAEEVRRVYSSESTLDE